MRFNIHTSDDREFASTDSDECWHDIDSDARGFFRRILPPIDQHKFQYSQSAYRDPVTFSKIFGHYLAGAVVHRQRFRALIGGRNEEFDTIEQKFEALSSEWKKFNGGRSVIEYNHAAFMQIVGMGPDVIPILLRRLHEGDGDWIVAMKYVTGQRVTTPEMRGNFRAIRDAWLRWGLENGFWSKLR